MKTKALSKLKRAELEQTLTEKRKKANELRMALATSKVKDIKELRETKKDIARILTIINTK